METLTGYGDSMSNADESKTLNQAAFRRMDHYFYTGMSIAVTITVFVGFAESFYLKSYFHTPALHLVALAHGVLNTCWILLFVLQNALIAVGRRGLHRRLGWGVAVLSLLLVPFAIATGIDSVRQGHIVNSPDIYAFLLTFTFRNTFVFAVLRAGAIYLRKNSEAHKRLALLAAIALFSEPSIGRIPGISFPIIVLLALAFMFAGPIYDLVSRRRVHAVYLYAIPMMLILSPLTPLMIIASRTSAWHDFTNWIIR